MVLNTVFNSLFIPDPNNDGFSFVICSAIIIWFAIFLFICTKDRIFVEKSLKNFRHSLKLIKTIGEPSSVKLSASLYEKFKTDPVLKYALYSFYKSLGKYKKSGVAHYYNRLSAEDYFNEHSLAGSVFEIKPITPTLLTAIGVFGTFCGLLISLSTSIKTNVVGGPSVVSTTLSASDITNMMAGAKTAFITSVWGVFFSIISNIYLRFSNFYLRRQIYILVRKVDEYYPSNISSEFDLKALGADAELSVQDSIRDMKSSLIQVISQSSEQSANLIASAITKHIKEINENSAKVIEATIDKLNESLSANIRAQAEETRQASQVFTESIRLSTEKIRSEFEGAASFIRTEFEKVGQKLSDLLNDSSCDLNKWAEIAKLLSEKGELMAGKINDVFNGLSYQTQTLALIDKNQQENAKALAEHMQVLAESSATYSSNIEKTEQLLKAMETYTQNWNKVASEIEGMKAEIEIMLKESLNSYSEGITKVTTDLTDRWGNLLKTAMIEITNGIKLINGAS